MGVARKKKRVENLSPIDRISALPDELVRQILGLMPTLDSVRTSVLSKRWNKLWTSVPNLDFNDLRDFPNDNADNDVQLRRPRCDRFVRFVGTVLYTRDSKDIGKFSLSVRRPHHLAVIDDWISVAVRRNVVDLKFTNVLETTSFSIPRCLLMCKTLIVLGLHVWDFDFATDPIPTSVCFPSRKVLRVSVSSDNLHLMGKLFSCCPVLEDLTIGGKVNIGDTDIGYNFNVAVPEVKKLNMCLPVGMARKGSRNIDVKDSKAENPPQFLSCAIVLLVAVSDVKYLSLAAPWSKVAECERRYPRCDWNLPKDVPICLLSNLKTISIKGFKGQWAEREIAEYLLMNGLSLHKMLIYTDGVFAVRDFHKEFSNMTGLVEFIQM
ncbi:hypothetical protein ACLB2K_018614 [Fragaria x ananassa]